MGLVGGGEGMGRGAGIAIDVFKGIVAGIAIDVFKGIVAVKGIYVFGYKAKQSFQA